MIDILFFLIDRLLVVVMLAVLVRCVISFLPLRRDNRFIVLLFRLTDPLISAGRALMDRILRGRYFPIDFSPMLVIIVIYLLQFLLGIIWRILL